MVLCRRSCSSNPMTGMLASCDQSARTTNMGAYHNTTHCRFQCKSYASRRRVCATIGASVFHKQRPFSRATRANFASAHRTHKKVWQKSLKFLNQDGEHENLIVAELNLRIVVNKVKFPFINKHSTGRIREGLCKDNTSKDPFSQCELYKEFAYRSKLSTWLQRQEFN